MSARSQSSLPSSSPEPARNDRGQTVESDATRSKRRKVSRSRAGCLTCRKRRKLCDMARPVCNACDRLEMVRVLRDLDVARLTRAGMYMAAERARRGISVGAPAQAIRDPAAFPASSGSAAPSALWSPAAVQFGTSYDVRRPIDQSGLPSPDPKSHGRRSDADLWHIRRSQ